MFKKFLCLVVMTLVLCGPAFAQKGGRSYSSGSSRSSSSSSSRSYSSPSKSSSSSYKSSPSKSYSSPSTKKSYSSGSSSSSSSSKKPAPATASKSYSSSSKPTKTAVGSSMSSSAKKVESEKKFVASTTPKSTYKTPGPSGTTKPLSNNNPHVQTVRKTVTHERYVTYDNRVNSFYGGHYSPVYYHDSFSPFLMGWLMSDALNSHQRAMWMYNHQSDMDSARYQALLAKDAKLQAELDLIKSQGVKPDPTYVPEQMKTNPDLMFNKEFVEASYNPVVTQQESTPSNWLFVVIASVSFLCAFCILGFFLFVKEF